MKHVLKCWPQYFARVQDGTKTFEVRNNDRDFQTGDILELVECDPDIPQTALYGYGMESRLVRRVTYVLHGGQFGIEPGYVVMGLETCPEGAE